jgi:hypothetical protein
MKGWRQGELSGVCVKGGCCAVLVRFSVLMTDSTCASEHTVTARMPCSTSYGSTTQDTRTRIKNT